MEQILFVDDDIAVLHGYQRTLSRLFNIVFIDNPQQAALLITSGQFDVIVSDYRMSGMDGLQLLALAKETTPDTVRILLTGVGDWEIALRAVNECSVFRFLAKPCGTDEISRVLKEGLEQARVNRLLSEELLRQGISPLKPVPICSYCKSVRVSDIDVRSPASWQKLEIAFGKRFGLQFSHGICPNCASRIYREIAQGNRSDL